MTKSSSPTPEPVPTTGPPPSRWSGPVAGIIIITLVALLTYGHAVDWHQLDWFERLTRPIGYVFFFWVGMQLVRRRPWAYLTGALFTGLISVSSLVVTIFLLIDPPDSIARKLLFPIAAVGAALLTWILWRDWRRTGKSTRASL